MSDVNWRLLIRRRDHTFRPPTPEMTARYGVPNACTTCHDDKTPEWATTQMDAWWGDGERRRASMATADLMYRAGSGDTSVVPDLARMAVDRSQGALLRASAADYIGRMLLGGAATGGAQQSQTSFGASASGGPSRPREKVAASPAVVNALMGAAADPEGMVRATAVRALAATGQAEKVLPALTARLIDPSRVVRVRAAEGLLALGIVELPGPAGQALARAQDEYLAGLRAFPDVASNHAAHRLARSLAWPRGAGPAGAGRGAEGGAALSAPVCGQGHHRGARRPLPGGDRLVEEGEGTLAGRPDASAS